MAKCFELESYKIETYRGRCFVTLEAWTPAAVEAFAKIVVSTFPESKFRRTTARPDTFLGLRTALRLVGDQPGGGGPTVNTVLELLSRSLTIEDKLDESHALAYHQQPDDTNGDLQRSPLGTLVIRAKYGNKRLPQEKIGQALAEFIRSHPRYVHVDAIASVPPHEATGTGSLARRLVNQLCELFPFDCVEIIRKSSREQQKEITDPDRRVGVRKRIANQKNSMRVEADLADSKIILVDDLYGSGGTMQEAARALRAAGAREVLGLTVTKQHLFEGVSLASLD